MPKHYAQGINIQQGRAVFKNRRNIKVYFSLAFSKVPMLKVSFEDTENAPSYKLYMNKSWFRLRFSQKYTGSIVWEASE